MADAALYRSQIGAQWVPVEIIGRHASGAFVLREVGSVFRGVLLATGDVRLPGPVLELRGPFGLPSREAA